MAVPFLLIQLGNSAVVLVPSVTALEAGYDPRIDKAAGYDAMVTGDASYTPTITREADER